MKFLKDLWHKILALDNQPLNDEIRKLQHQVEELQSQELEYKKDILSKEALLNHYIDVIEGNAVEYEDKIAELKALLAENEVYDLPNIDVDWDKHPYFPSTMFTYYDSTKKKNVNVFAQLTPSKYYRCYSDEMYNYVNNGMKGYAKKSMLEQVKRLRDLVCDRVTYHHDLTSEGALTENWKLPMQTFYERVGDCDDMCVLWVTFCKIYGIPSDRVFNLTGFYGNAGHSFGGFLDDKNNMQIIECTTKSRVIPMKDSQYRCKGSLNGLSNWSCSGVPRTEQF